MIQRHVNGLNALVLELRNESEKAKNRGKWGRQIGIGLGLFITGLGLVPTIFGVTDNTQWLVGVSAFFGLMVTINSQVMDPEKRHKRAEDSANLMSIAQTAANDLELAIGNANLDSDSLTKLLEKARSTKKDIDAQADQDGLNTNPDFVYSPYLSGEK